MKVTDAIAAMKEFFLEILGFLLPGLTFLLLTYFFLDKELQQQIDTFLSKEQASTIVVIVSYVLGYVLFGISCSFQSLQNKNKPSIIFNFLRKVHILETKSKTSNLEVSIKKSPLYKITLDILNSILKIQKDELSSMPFREVRNIAMSYVPEADRKIYNFMFRSELSDKVGFALKIIAFLGLCSCLLSLIEYPFKFRDYMILKTNGIIFIHYLLLLIIAYFLKETKDRFYSIAMRIVFPIFVAKFKTGEDE